MQGFIKHNNRNVWLMFLCGQKYCGSSSAVHVGTGGFFVGHRRLFLWAWGLFMWALTAIVLLKIVPSRAGHIVIASVAGVVSQTWLPAHRLIISLCWLLSNRLVTMYLESALDNHFCVLIQAIAYSSELSYSDVSTGFLDLIIYGIMMVNTVSTSYLK